MRVSDFIRPNSRHRLHDIFGAGLAPIAWSLDAPRSTGAAAAGIPRSVVFKGEGSLRSGWSQAPKLDSPAEQDRTICGRAPHRRSQ